METVKLALDTNIWIYLTKPNFNDLFQKLVEEKNKGSFDLIINDIILDEWNRNKEQTIKSLVFNIESDAKSALHIVDYIEDDHLKESMRSIIYEYKAEERKRIEAAKLKVEQVENFMKSCTNVPIDQVHILHVANLAIHKEPPFENNKNNFNDALIIRSLADYSKTTPLPYKYDLIFVSNNQKDFIDNNTGMIYSSLLNGIGNVRVQSVSDLGQGLHLAPEYIDEFDEWLEAELENQAWMEWEISRGK